MKTFFLIAIILCPLLSQARIVTLITSPENRTNSISIGTNEYVEVISGGLGSGNGGSIVIEKPNEGFPPVLRQSLDLLAFSVPPSSSGGMLYFRHPKPIIYAGPAKISLVEVGTGWGDGFNSVTLDIKPDSFPPDKTVIVPDGGGADISLESSTNLIDWKPATPGLYTNKTGNLFFRIRADRIP